MYTCISFPHDVDTTGGQQLQSAFYLQWDITQGGHPSHHAEGLVNPKVRALKKGY
jgi:hypothetical protein